MGLCAHCCSSTVDILSAGLKKKKIKIDNTVFVPQCFISQHVLHRLTQDSLQGSEIRMNSLKFTFLYIYKKEDRLSIFYKVSSETEVVAMPP